MQEKDAREENTGVSKSSNMESKQKVTRKTMAGDLWIAILTYLPPGLIICMRGPYESLSKLQPMHTKAQVCSQLLTAARHATALDRTWGC